MDKATLLRQAAIAAHNSRKASEHLRSIKNELQKILAPGDRSYALNGGETIGTITMTLPKPTPVITDETAFAKWAQANGHQDAVTLAVRDWFKSPTNLKALIADGELPDGVTIDERPPYVAVRVTADQDEAIQALYHDGQLDT